MHRISSDDSSIHWFQCLKTLARECLERPEDHMHSNLYLAKRFILPKSSPDANRTIVQRESIMALTSKQFQNSKTIPKTLLQSNHQKTDSRWFHSSYLQIQYQSISFLFHEFHS